MAGVTPPLPNSGRLILDTGGLLAWAYGDPFARAVIRDAEIRGILVIVPVLVIAQAIRGGPADAPVNQALKRIGEPAIASSRAARRDIGHIAPITTLLARQAGTLLGASETTDVVDAVIVAKALRFLPTAILTSGPHDIRRLVQSDPAHARVQVIAV
jgi:hypothetical protein